MAMKLYEYAVIYEPAKDKDGKYEGGETPAVIVPVTTTLVKDEATATLKAAREIPDEYTEKLDRVTVVVRPF